MSLQTLLAEYPKYSARKVRKLAAQLNWLGGIPGPMSKEIQETLINYHLIQAQTEQMDALTEAGLQAKKLRFKSGIPAPLISGECLDIGPGRSYFPETNPGDLHD